MKTLYLIRHAKSDWAIETIPDVDRPLNSRGYADSHKMSQELKEKKISPDLVLSSPAIRAISTALIFCRKLNYDPSLLMINKNLYYTNAKEYLKVIGSIDNKYNTVFLFGHNPIITDCANVLAGPLAEEMSTCGIAGIKSKTNDWASFKDGPNELIHFDFPKNHP